MEPRDERKRLLRSTAAVALPTLLSRILGYVRDYFQAFYLGTSRAADAFTIAYIIPNLLRRLTGEGAMTSAFIPVFTEIKKEKPGEEVWKFANYFFFDLTVVMAVLAVLGMVFAPLLVRVIGFGFKNVQGTWDLTVVLTRIMFPYIFFISLAALAMGILNSFHKFFVPAFSPVLLNLSIIGCVYLFARRTAEPAYVFAAGVLAGGVFQLLFQLPFLRRQGMRFKPGLSISHPAVRKVARLTLPGVLGIGVYQVNFALSRAFASALEEGSVAALYYSSRIQELTLGLFSVALSIAVLPAFSEQAAGEDIPGMKKTLSFSLKLTSLITFPAAAGLLILNRPIIQVLFERGVFDAWSTGLTAACLLYFSLSLPFISGVKILAPAFFSLKDTKTPVVVASLVMVVYIVSAFVLMRPLKVGGIAMALSVSQLVNFLELFRRLERKIGPLDRRNLMRSVCTSFFGAVAMGAALWIFISRFDFGRMGLAMQATVLFSAILLGIAFYAFMIFLVDPRALRSFQSLLPRKDFWKNKRG